ncbi:histidinol-phosphate transaminase [Acinetobacter sichuanensis]|uniref:histidinol-phosphate transaminase n=1 Tax=Acinetobacter sichuanensis TaxID=2136183 RepID=UPI00280E01A0|nr:histidinol-phosphate transaminase [Acinetobacter sichuanensis]MDQ9021347.1 histidinol-phosphate transaminase [Acinetobacter sichuanensis]
MEVIDHQYSSDPIRFLSPNIRTLQPYVSGEQSKNDYTLKLNTNENPYPPSPQVAKAIQQLLSNSADCLRLYPDPDVKMLRANIAQQQHVDINQVFVGNGSDEVLAFIYKAFFSHPAKSILYPDISYSFYPVYKQFYCLNAIAIPVNANFQIQPQDYDQENCGIIIANPNAPTGIALELVQIEEILKLNQNSVVVIDEAYIDFGAQSAVELIPHYDNLVVCQTTSKSRSLAGLRVGFAIAQAHLIHALDSVKNCFNSFTVDQIAIAAASASFEDQSYFEQCCQQIIENREFLIHELEQLGFQILPSKANFIFVHHPNTDAKQLAQQLKQQNILIRHFDQPRINQYLRISIGTLNDNIRLVNALKTILIN